MTRPLRPAAPPLLGIVSSALILGGALCGPARAETRVRVLLETAPALSFSASSPVTIYALGSGRRLGVLPEGEALRFRAAEGYIHWAGGASAENLRLRPRGSLFRLGRRRFRGSLDIVRRRGRLRAVNVAGVEDYLRGVLPREMPSRFPIEALKAQAVAARTFILWRRGEKGEAPGTKGSEGKIARATAQSADVSTQVYGGADGETPPANRAVAETSGEILTFAGELAQTYFHASSPGRTEEKTAVFGGSRLPYLRSVPSFGDSAQPRFRWTHRVSLARLSRRLSAAGRGVGEVHTASIEERSPSGRVRALRVWGTGGSVILWAGDLRRLLGWGAIRSAYFDMEQTSSALFFHGAGSGHGVGMSQWGARAMALNGKGYREILAHYFPGTRLERPGPEAAKAAPAPEANGAPEEEAMPAGEAASGEEAAPGESPSPLPGGIGDIIEQAEQGGK
ncbi:MAG: SpoIID/LytB domain-containing protein [bacterium]